LPEFGFEEKEIPFVIEIDKEGNVVQLRDTRRLDGKKLRGQRFVVPRAEKKSVNVKANLLWGSAEYVIGLERKGKSRASKAAQAFLDRIEDLPEPAQSDSGVKAVLAALRRGEWKELRTHHAWQEVEDNNAVLSFCLTGETELVCQRAAVVEAVRKAPSEAAQGFCLVEGAVRPIARLHPAVKGVAHAQSSGANIVSFNERAFESYGKTKRQGENAPIGEGTAFAYTTALNHLLRHGSRNRVQVGDASTIFWADRDSRFDSEFTLADFFGDADDPDRNVGAVKALYESIGSGRLGGDEGRVHFFVLGLSPNVSRISIRFALHAPLADLAPRIAQHFRDLALVRSSDRDSPTPSLSRLLCALAAQGKVENVSPRLAGEWMRAILEGLPYPNLLLTAAVIRCRAEQGVGYLRAAVLKAWLNREHRRRNPDLPTDYAHFKEELDVTQTDEPYRLGRLFALLERIQEVSALPQKLNATIRDRYYGAASSTPVAVFTTLLRLKNAHLNKLDQGAKMYYEKLLGEVFGSLESPGLQSFPAQLTLPEQSRFALGYYHQRQSLFRRKDKASGGEQS
jgi:CRISPR-associated protein Csd1